MLSWRVLQLADTGFPTGGFAHSGGLEVALQSGEAARAGGLDAFLGDALWNVGFGLLPFVSAAHAEALESRQRATVDAPFAALDAALDALLANHVANRASRTQGRAFVATCARIFPTAKLEALDRAVRARRLAAHHAPLFGAALAVLEVPSEETRALYLHLALRGLLSAAVRLGAAGPHEGQRLHDALCPTLDAVLAASRGLPPEEAAFVAPIPEIVAGAHDRLYARLFQS